MDENDITALEHLIAHVNEPYLDAKKKLAQVQEEIGKLDGHTCTGAIWWRDPDSDKRRMYINHRKNESCPLHGTPERDKRLRIYIGSDPDKQAAARTLLDAEARLTILRRTERKLNAGLSQAFYRLRDYYKALCYIAPDSWDPAADPRPDPRRPW